VKLLLNNSKIFYGWIIVAVSLGITSTAFGVLYSFGVFFKSWLSEWAMTRAFISGAFSVSFLVYGLFSIIMGRACDRYGPRKTIALGGFGMGAGCILTALSSKGEALYLTWGVLVGIGAGTAYAPTAATVSKWFVKRKGLAVGVVVSGLGMGTLLFSPFSEFLINFAGWRWAAVVLGLIVWTVFLSGAYIIRREPAELGLEPLGAASVVHDSPDGEKVMSVTLSSAIHTRSFWVLFTIHGLWILGVMVAMVHLIPYATDCGVASNRAARMQALIGAMSVLGRVSLGVLTERFGPRRSLSTLLGIQTISMIWLVVSRSEWMLWIFTFAFGFSYGGIASVFPLFTAELYGLRALATIFGFILFGATIGGTIGPILGGIAYDFTSEYWGGFLSGALSMAIGAILCLSLPKRTEARGCTPQYIRRGNKS
jgi:MFS family permease